MNRLSFYFLGVVAWLVSTPVFADSATVERGRYLVAVGDCNGCHTAGFAETGGQVPEAERLAGNSIGFAGPWGVSYAHNLRLSVAAMTPDQWLARLAGGGLPPMPWPVFTVMTRDDQLAIYDYLKALGPTGETAPYAKAPGESAETPFFVLFPQTDSTFRIN